MRSLRRSVIALALMSGLVLLACGSADTVSSDEPTESDAAAALISIDQELDDEIGDPPDAVSVHADMATRCLEPSASSEPGVLRAYDTAEPDTVVEWYSTSLVDHGWELAGETDVSQTYEKDFGLVTARLLVDTVSDLGDIWVSASVDFQFCS